jgi:hypothetical protein
MRRWCVLGVVAAAALAGCGVPYDDDGEMTTTRQFDVGAAPDADATPVVVDTDLGGDDLVGLAFLLRHPSVRVEAVTIAGTGLVGCDPGVDLVADLFTALDEDPVPVACGREEAGPGGAQLPQDWRVVAATGSGLPRSDTTLTPVRESAPELIGSLAEEIDGLVVVALGPMTNLADLAATPDELGRLAGIHAMGGSVDGPLVDGIAEWNVAADPEAFATVLAAGVPLTVVPEDAIPEGTPAALSAPVVGDIASTMDYPKWWDLATVAALVTPPTHVDEGAWGLDPAEPGRLVRTVDAATLERDYDLAFTTD